LHKKLLLLSHGHKQVHIVMDSAVEVKGTCHIEWSHDLLVVAIQLCLDSGRAGFDAWSLEAIAIPFSILDDMYHGNIINERQFIALLDGDAGWYKLCFVHMYGCNRIVTCCSSGGRRTGRK